MHFTRVSNVSSGSKEFLPKRCCVVSPSESTQLRPKSYSVMFCPPQRVCITHVPSPLR